MDDKLMVGLRVIFLGTGASVPKRERGFPATLLLYKKACILIDCGDGATAQLAMIKEYLMKDIIFIFITHEHFDHYSGISGLLYSNCVLRRKNPLWIYGNSTVIRNIKAMIEMLEKDVTFPINMVQMEEGLLVDYKDLRISSFPTRHSDESYGFRFEVKDDKEKRIKKIVYLSDTMFFQELIDISRDSDLLITECTYLDKDLELARKYKHLALSDVKRIKKESKSKLAIINHVSRRYRLDDIKQYLDEDILLSYDQFEYQL